MQKRLDNETLADYEERLYKNRVRYNLNWQDVTDLLELEQHHDTTRKASYGYLRRVKQEQLNTFDKSVMIINDIHLPYEREDVLDLIAKHKDEITHLVIGGDLLDNHSISFFGKIETITLEEELIYASKWLHEVRKILNKEQEIILINGNHEERWETEIKKMHQKNMQKFINPNLLEMLVEGFTIYNDGNKQTYKGIENAKFIPHWFINIDNKLVVAHPKSFSQVDGRMCENVVAHFLNRGEHFDVVVFGHTHKYSEMTVSRRAGKYAVENGCLCKNADYGDSGKINFTPQHYCYTIIKWNDSESINYNNIKVYHLDEIHPRNKFKVEI